MLIVAFVHRCKLELTVGDNDVGAIELGLWRGQAPSAVDAFVAMCNSELLLEPLSPDKV